MSEKHIPLTPQDSAILLIDHQTGVLNMVSSVPRDVVAANVGILAKLGEQTELPLVISTTREEIEFLGTSIEEIQTGATTYATASPAAGP